MFAYLDPSVRQKLARTGQLIRIDAGGQQIPVDAVSSDSDLTINVVGPIPLPVTIEGEEVTFQWYAFVRHTELAKANEIADALRSRGDQRLFSILSSAMSVNSALVWGDPGQAELPLVRVHSCCVTGDVFGSQRCECGPQLRTALARIRKHPDGGVLIYMSGHEGRGIGLWAKAVTYLLQDGGQNTYQANRSLGLPDDSRDFSDAAAMLLFLRGGNRPMRLMSNNPKKLEDLRKHGLTHIETEKHIVGVNEWNRRYLAAKRDWGHSIEFDEIEE